VTIAIPSTLDVLQPYELVKTPMGTRPVVAALSNCNHLWQYFAPPLIDVCPSQSFTSSGIAQRYVTVLPDAPVQAIEHDFLATVVTSTTATIGLDVEYATAWVSFAGTTWASLGTDSQSINGRGSLGFNAAIPSNAVALRWKFTASTGNYTVHHLLATPDDDTITTTGKQAGFVAYDDGLLENGDQPPVNTEMVNRVTRNCNALCQRHQAALSYVQPESSTYGQTPSTTANHTIAKCRIWMGARDSAGMVVKAIGTVGLGTSWLRITQVPADGQPIAGGFMQMDMDGTIQTGTIVLVGQGGGVMRFADVLVQLIGPTTTVYSFHGWLAE
jgi:hypothetical protein